MTSIRDPTVHVVKCVLLFEYYCVLLRVFVGEYIEFQLCVY